MAIKWLGRVFEGPFPIKYWEPYKHPVVFAVMVKPNPKTAPVSFRILFFGHTARVADSGYFMRHRKVKCWINLSGAFEGLHIGFHVMPDSSPEERDQIVDELIRRYKPICNY